MEDEWDLELGGIRTPIFGGNYMRLYKDSHNRLGIYFTVKAYEAIGSPEYIRFYLHKILPLIKVDVCQKGDNRARRLRVQKSAVGRVNKINVSGAPSLIKAYGMKPGFYEFQGNGVFKLTDVKIG